MKQQRGFVHYKRNKKALELAEKAAKMLNKNTEYGQTINPKEAVKQDHLVLAIRIKGNNSATTPQAQKILSELGLREINNAVFLHTDVKTMTKLMIIKDYISFGYPSKKLVNDLVRKRGFLRKGEKKLPITDNVLIEELLGKDDCICIEDVINAIHKCYENVDTFQAI